MKSSLLHSNLFVVSIFFLSCCSGIKSHSKKESGVDLKQYKTYTWTKPGDEEYHVTYDKKEAIGFILELSNEAIKQKGFVQNMENPDAVFLVDTSIEDRIAYGRISSNYNEGFGIGTAYYGGYSVGYAGPVSSNTIVETEFQQGMLFVEMYDAKTKKLVWRGWAEAQITNKTKLDKLVRKAVKEVFGHLQVKHK